MTVRSMTGFASVEHGPSGAVLSVELRSVNHRYLDIVVRMPERCRRHETVVQSVLREALGRGRIEAVVELSGERWGTRLVLDAQIVTGLLEAAGELRERLQGSGTGITDAELSLADLIGVPGVVRPAEDDLGAPDLAEMLRETTRKAAKELVAARRDEGQRLETVLREVLKELSALEQNLRAEAQVLAEEGFRVARSRLEKLLGDAEIDDDRVLQEAAHLAERSDVAEELDRLGAHLELFHELLGRGEPIGRKLDFLCQEILRELNTLATKARLASVSHAVVEAKALCERLREQVQNVE